MESIQYALIHHFCLHWNIRDIMVLSDTQRLNHALLVYCINTFCIYYLKGRNLMEYDVLLFPIHKPMHWSLVVLNKCSFINAFNVHLQVVYPHICTIYSIDSLHRSDEDAINWIWLMQKKRHFLHSLWVQLLTCRLYLNCEMQYHKNAYLSRSDWKYSDSVVRSIILSTKSSSYIYLHYRTVICQGKKMKTTVVFLCA